MKLKRRRYKTIAAAYAAPTIGNYTHDQIRELLMYINALEDKLDALDEEDYFGTEGWKHVFGLD